ncbi:MAG: response regulator, partial [Desulfamplus sp.]|nr:response regulator [Desulfamplus sp.]
MQKKAYRILIVCEDTPVLSTLLAILESDPEYKILVRKTFDEVFECVGSSIAPNLILIDIPMSSIDGYQLSYHLKKEPCAEDIPIIFITMHYGSDTKSIIRAFESGAVDYITRPLCIEIVRLKIKNLLKLAESNRKYQAILNAMFYNIRDGVSISYLRGPFIQVNEALCINTGYSREELLTMHPKDIVCDSDSMAIKERCQLLENNGRGAFEVCILRKDGTIFLAELNASIVVLKSTMVISITRVITDSTQKDEKLKKYKNQLDRLIAHREDEQNKMKFITDVHTDVHKQNSITSTSIPNIVGKHEVMQNIYSH